MADSIMLIVLGLLWLLAVTPVLAFFLIEAAARAGYSTSAFKSPHYYVFLVLSVGVSVPLILTGIFSLPGPQP